MCGRFAMDLETDVMIVEFVAAGGDFRDWRPRFNIAPTTTVPVLHQPQGERILAGARWGLVPASSPTFGGGAPVFNARVETVTSKPLFAQSFGRRRCLVPALGYYEWQATAGGKQPFLIGAPDAHLTMAGILTEWVDRSAAPDDPGRVRLSMSIITLDAAEPLAHLHPRMPAFIAPDDRDDWLGEHLTVPGLLDLVTASSHRVAHELAHHPVSRQVNSVRNDGPHLVQPVDPADEEPLTLF